MGYPSSSSSSLPLKLAFILSFSLTTSSSSKSHHNFFSIRSFNSIKPSASASDILSLLNTPQQASSVNPQLASQLNSCFKFLVPFNPTSPSDYLINSEIRFPRRTLYSKRCSDSVNHENELVWSPPAPVLEIARLAFDSGGDPASIQRLLDPTMIYVPDVEGSNENRCELTRTPYGRRFINEELNSYMEFLFKLIAERGPKVGLNVSLSRFDFFHGHLFITADGRVGILFHAKEYPAYDEEVFPYNMGYCQKGSNVTYDDSMNLRNILWLAPLPSNSTSDWSAPGVLVVLDAHPGGIIYRDIIPEYVNYARTIYEVAYSLEEAKRTGQGWVNASKGVRRVCWVTHFVFSSLSFINDKSANIYSGIQFGYFMIPDMPGRIAIRLGVKRTTYFEPVNASLIYIQRIIQGATPNSKQ
ncbi:hypothetical protein QVD17_06288 [Tagetes erecta]|uniref:Uncharacterized protein n=1 Tax=Tagetes erecta TaxID=13708 RepID=A0AAD8PC50_TARER|nr:hypothetical protein QVD17_06288 [Tagetes erecta]